MKQLLADENDTGSGKLLAIGKNSYGRCTLHIAVLCQQEEIVDFITNMFPDTLRIGDNVRIFFYLSLSVFFPNHFFSNSFSKKHYFFGKPHFKMTYLCCHRIFNSTGAYC